MKHAIVPEIGFHQKKSDIQLEIISVCSAQTCVKVLSDTEKHPLSNSH